MAEKRYYWLRLYDDFFDSKRIKKMRRLAGGDTYLICYLKMQLLAMKSDGILKYTGLEPTFAEELSLDLDETAENIAMTISYLVSCGLAETNGDSELLLPWAVKNVGSEGSSAARMRAMRDKEKQIEKLPSQSDKHPSQCAHSVTEIQETRDKKQETIEIDYSYPQSAEEVRIFLKSIRSEAVVDAELFYNTNAACGWKNADGKLITDWKRYLCGIVKGGGTYHGPQSIHGKTTEEGAAGRFDGLNLYDVE